MSDTSQGPGWWLASDGKWYPPEAWTGPPRQSDAVGAGAGIPSYPTGTPTGHLGGAAYPGSAGYPAYGAMPFQGQRSNNGMAVASLICSCLGIIPFGFGIPCILGIIFGFVARSQIRRSNDTQQGSGLALAGIIVGFSLIGLFIVLIVVVAIVHPCTTSNGTTTCA
jgi:Domain of unknown function (DUF4190)